MRLRKGNSRTVAVLGPTNLDWVVTVFALSKAGYKTLTLSPRLSSQAILRLMKETECQCLIQSDEVSLQAVLQELRVEIDIQVMIMLTRSDYDKFGESIRPYVREVDVAEETKNILTILHSSGSTGLPKSIYITHARYLQSFPLGDGLGDLMTSPLSVLFLSSPQKCSVSSRSATID